MKYAVLAVALISFPALADSGKRDLLGFSPGMTLASAKAFGAKRNFRCETVPKATFALVCRNGAQTVTLVSGFAEGSLIYDVQLKVDIEDLAAGAEKVSKEFGRPPDFVPPSYEPVQRYEWKLETGEKVKLKTDVLTLTSLKIFSENSKQDKAARKAKQLSDF
ncbi:hypothetical protein BjapCC829_23735 [Bradyrhizobium barranii]|uniref:Uncharacterized protein n=1 Tax=Bradyrhizobium barranii TaxID=2992140 RepID=A0ABY3QAY3_9BRAD|nr:hypothetical protein [Bradyrhizobium japonicum]UFW83000.1 hypothetical protein BjapCC829_23735 [Bradyrhizobium japonicum]